MVLGLEVIPYNIVEPWTEDDNDVAHYLYDMGLKFSMCGVSTPDGSDNTIIYTVNITPEDATVIKLIFPGIHVFPCKLKEKVSIMAREVCKNTTVL